MAPTAAVPPRRQCTDEKQYEYDEKNGPQHVSPPDLSGHTRVGARVTAPGRGKWALDALNVETRIVVPSTEQTASAKLAVRAIVVRHPEPLHHQALQRH